MSATYVITTPGEYEGRILAKAELREMYLENHEPGPHVEIDAGVERFINSMIDGGQLMQMDAEPDKPDPATA